LVAGLHVVVTGAGRGLGRAIALDLAGRGARVLAADIDAVTLSALQEEAGRSEGRLRVYACDVSSEASVSALMTAADSEGSLDAVVHSAALVAVTRAPAADLSMTEFDRVMTVNARGTWLVARAAVPRLAQKQGSLVLFSSDTAFTGSRGLSHYAASKGAVLAMMRAFAGEAGPLGVRVNAVSPGYTDTEGARSIGDPDKYDTHLTPLGRVGRPDDVLGAVRYLVSEDSRFVTAQTIHVNGGRVSS
jgi:NAD(P)-dependent dehydrogenase (short-subunit alcohol dehydrogenase family)